LIIKRTTAYNVEIPGPYLGETLKYGEVQHNYVIQPPVGNGISNGIAQMRKKKPAWNLFHSKIPHPITKINNNPYMDRMFQI
jgi:hypothetical protein